MVVIFFGNKKTNTSSPSDTPIPSPSDISSSLSPTGENLSYTPANTPISPTSEPDPTPTLDPNTGITWKLVDTTDTFYNSWNNKVAV